MTLTVPDLQSIQATLKPEFDKVHAEAKQNFTVLNQKIGSLSRSNRKDHNLIIKTFDERDIKLKKRVSVVEGKLGKVVFPL